MITIARDAAFLSLAIILSLPALTLDPTPYQAQAEQWIDTYMSDDDTLLISADDAELIANLLYFSFLRSATTLEAQDIAKSTLETIWQGWQNIAQTRMNPSLKLPYHTDLRMQQELFTDFIYAQHFHRTMGQTYAECAEVAVKGKWLDNTAQKAVDALRHDARMIAAQAFLDVKKIVAQLYDIASDYMRIEDDMFADESIRFDMIETFAQYLPSLAMKSFIESERIYTKASEESWHIAHTITTINMQIWHTIETARACYYLAHYNAFLAALADYDLDELAIMFDHNGLIESSLRDEKLPAVIKKH
jgi:hypothetical protein